MRDATTPQLVSYYAHTPRDLPGTPEKSRKFRKFIVAYVKRVRSPASLFGTYGEYALILEAFDGIRNALAANADLAHHLLPSWIDTPCGGIHPTS